ncbi:MAG: TetR/AcrR family transcriptional regulator [Clostridia bacterium]|nr:TetR/AcrR family transcriptional regulator [Clostridia bacterium]
MMEAGIPLLKEKGMLHMSITKLTEAVGIGKSTFYNFYPSKEVFVEHMLEFHRKQMIKRLKEGLQGREKYSKEEGIEIIDTMISNANNVYQNFSQDDEIALQKMHEKNGTAYPDLNKESRMIDMITSMFEGVKPDLDYAVISNLMKLIVLASEQKRLLHESGYERMLNSLVTLLCQSIFEE